jgi:hypothetical protein
VSELHLSGYYQYGAAEVGSMRLLVHTNISSWMPLEFSQYAIKFSGFLKTYHGDCS